MIFSGVVLALMAGCQGDVMHETGPLSINTVPGADNGHEERIDRAQLSPSEPLILGFDHESDLFTESGVLLFRRARLYYSADEGRSTPGSILVQNRGATWHGPLFRLPFLASGKAFRIAAWIKLADVEKPTVASLIVIHMAAGETRPLKLAEVNLTPGIWSELEGDFIAALEVTDDIVAAYIDVEAPTAKYFLDDFSIAYTDASEDLSVLAADEARPGATSLVVNGSAEDGLEPWGSQGAVISRSAKRAHTGVHSILVENRSQDWHAPTIDVRGLQDDIEYRFSIFVYIEDGQQASDMKLTLKRYTDGEVSYDPLAIKKDVGSGSWVEVSGKFVAANASQSQAMTVYLEATDPNLSYYVDTLTVEEVQ